MVLTAFVLHVIVSMLGGPGVPSSREAAASPSWLREADVIPWLREGESAGDAAKEHDLFPRTRESVAGAIPREREAMFVVASTGDVDIPPTREEDPRAPTVPAWRDE